MNKKLAQSLNTGLNNNNEPPTPIGFTMNNNKGEEYNKIEEINKTVENLNSQDTSKINEVLNSFYEEQNNKELKTNVYGNYTFIVEHDLVDRLNELSTHYHRGFKSELVNLAIKTFVELYEGKELPEKKRKKRGR